MQETFKNSLVKVDKVSFEKFILHKNLALHWECSNRFVKTPNWISQKKCKIDILLDLEKKKCYL
jgi:hypothetical protein